MNPFVKAKRFLLNFHLAEDLLFSLPSFLIALDREHAEDEKYVHTHLAIAMTPTSFLLTHDLSLVQTPLTATRICICHHEEK